MTKRELGAAEGLVLLKRQRTAAHIETWLPEGAHDVFDRVNMIVRCMVSHPPETQGLQWQRASDGPTPCPRCVNCSWQVTWISDGSLRCMACAYRRF